MRLYRLSYASALISLGLAFAWGCADTVEDIDRTSPNALPKSLFDGEWYFSRVTIDSPFETEATFVGDRQDSSFGEAYHAWKIRWRIEEDKLFACRSDEVTEGESNSAGHENLLTAEDGDIAKGEEDLSQEKYGELADMGKAKFPCKYPIAAFKIKSHFDIRRDYNSATGEQTNVISENTSDRPWYDRDYIRVDWTDIGVTSMALDLDGAKFLGWIGGIENNYFVQEETGDCRVINKDGTVDYSNCEEGFLPPIIEDDNILITNRMTVVPEDGLISCYMYSVMGYGVPCTNVEIGMRYAFRKVPNLPAEKQYEPLYYPDDRFERFGVWRVRKDNYVRGLGSTDFRNYRATRFNLWEENFTNCKEDTKPCADNEYNCLVEVAPEDGHHIYKRCEPIPVEKRIPKPIDYYLNREFPNDLKPAAFQVAKNWSDAYVGINDAITEDGCHIQCTNGSETKFDDDCLGVKDGKPSYAENDKIDWKWSMKADDGHYCMFNLHENDGQQFMGDLRYNFIAHVEDNGRAQPCGIGGPANDPATGELINATAYVYGNCFDYYETRVLDSIALLCATRKANGEDVSDMKACTELDASNGLLGEVEFMNGINFVKIAQEQGHVHPAADPIYHIAMPESNSRQPKAAKNIQAKLAKLKQNARDVQNNRSIFLRRAEKLSELGYDRMMIDDVIAREISGGRAKTASELTDEEVAFISPLNPQASTGAQFRQQLYNRAEMAIEPAEFLFNDLSIWGFAKANKDKSVKELRQLCRAESFRATVLHELGHNQGMRHNFRGTVDRAHFPMKYWELKAEAETDAIAAYKASHNNAVPPTSFDIRRGYDADSDEQWTEAEYIEKYKNWNEYKTILRNIELEKNIGLYKYSSIMDYHGLLHGDWNGLGAYDKAFMRYLYADLIDNPICPGQSIDDCEALKSGEDKNHDGLLDTSYTKYFLGGESCDSDSDCPAASYGQTCDENAKLGIKLCSNWYNKLSNIDKQYVHQFCSDERVEDDPFCNRFDVGETAEEIIRSKIDWYHDLFIYSRFRRYRTAFSAYGYMRTVFDRGFRLIGDMMQSLLYRYFYEDGFKDLEGPTGWDDMSRAIIIGFDFLGNVLMKPESGYLEWDRDSQMYTQSDDQLVTEWQGFDASAKCYEYDGEKCQGVDLPLGQGEPAYSSYEKGYFGETDRLAYIGSFYAKIAAIETLTQRYWGASNLSNENKFYLNFYDFFPAAYLRLMSAVIGYDNKEVANRIVVDSDHNVTLYERNYWDGRDIMDVDDAETTFGSAIDSAAAAPGKPVAPGAEFYLNYYGMIYGALDVAYYSDTSFADSMRVFEVGSGSGFDLSNIDPSKVSYATSPVTHRTFAAVEYEEGGSIGRKALDHFADLARRYEVLKAAYAANDLSVITDAGLGEDYADLSVGELEYAVSSVKNQITRLETALSNVAYICDELGIGRL